MIEANNHLKKEIEAAAQLLSSSRSAVALTGAGFSTPSGIPDFRSPQSGLWETHNPMEVANIDAFRQAPQNFYEWIRPLVQITSQAKPNPAHLALAQLEEMGKLSAVITQNIDGLHTKAGSQTVYEVHGHVREVECLTCGHHEAAEPFMLKLAADGSMPTCPSCAAIMKPKVILFGELLPFEIMTMAQNASETADLMIVAGSSLEVAPVSQLPWAAKRHQARLIIINFDPTPADQLADIIIRGDVAEVFPAIISAMQN